MKNELGINDDSMDEIDCYLLFPDTIDREAIESRMAKDVDLALEVARRVEELQLVSMAAERFAAEPRKNAVQERFAWTWAVAALLLFVLVGTSVMALVLPSSPIRFRPAIVSTPDADTAPEDLARIASSWLAMEHPDGSVEDVDENEMLLATGVQLYEDEGDWIIQAAQQMYSDSEI